MADEYLDSSLHICTLNEIKHNIISSTSYFRSPMAHACMFMPWCSTNRLVYETIENTDGDLHTHSNFAHVIPPTLIYDFSEVILK